ncbi:MAG: phospholipase D-like domain-containing protein [Bdellovibrionota bacterium]
MKYLCSTLITFLIVQNAFALEAYFNHNARSQYKDPYRGITRRGDDLEAVILKKISTAKKSVFVAVQELRLPSVALLLAEKKKAGLDVRVIVERDYNFDVLHQSGGDDGEGTDNRDLRAFIDINKNGKLEASELESRDAIYILGKNKVPVIDDSFGPSMGSALMHHKFVIIDGKSTIISTANFTLSCIHGDYNTPTSMGNPNSMIVADSAEMAAHFTEEFLMMWGNGKQGAFGLNKRLRAPKVFTVGGTKVTVQFSPASKTVPFEQTTNGLIIQYMKKATRSFKAALFVFSEQKLVDALEVKHNAGVDVGTVIEARFAYRDYSELLDMLGLEMLGVNCKAEEGNKPWKNPIREGGMANLPGGDKLHHKYAVIDGKYTLVGSHNWSDSANNANDETMLVIENTSISDLYTQEYERILKTSTIGVTTKAEADIQKRLDSCGRKGLL